MPWNPFGTWQPPESQTEVCSGLSYTGRSAQENPRKSSFITHICQKGTHVRVQSFRYGVASGGHDADTAVELQRWYRLKVLPGRTVVRLCCRLAHAVPEEPLRYERLLSLEYVVGRPTQLLRDDRKRLGLTVLRHQLLVHPFGFIALPQEQHRCLAEGPLQMGVPDLVVAPRLPVCWQTRAHTSPDAHRR